MKNNKIKLIFNPGAGAKENASTVLEQVTRKLQDLGFIVDVAVAHPKKAAIPIARKAARDGYKLVVAMGGDGTVEAVASGLVGSKTRLGILPSGTYNNIARSLGIPPDLDAACEVLREGKKQRMDVGRVRINGKTRYFFEQVASGLSALVFPEVKDVHTLGPAKVARAVTKFLRFKIPHYSLKLDRESRIETDTLLVTIANTPMYGAALLEAPEASLADGLLEICLYPGFNKAELAAYFASIMNGGQSTDERVQRYRARKISLNSRPRQGCVADNRVLGRGKAKIKLLRRALRIVAPARGGVAKPAEQVLPAPAVPVSETQEEPDTAKNNLKI